MMQGGCYLMHVFIKVVLPLEGIDPPFLSSSVSSVALSVICLFVVCKIECLESRIRWFVCSHLRVGIPHVVCLLYLCTLVVVVDAHIYWYVCDFCNAGLWFHASRCSDQIKYDVYDHLNAIVVLCNPGFVPTLNEEECYFYPLFWDEMKQVVICFF
jgi:hypothetical protein